MPAGYVPECHTTAVVYRQLNMELQPAKGITPETCYVFSTMWPVDNHQQWHWTCSSTNLSLPRWAAHARVTLTAACLTESSHTTNTHPQSSACSQLWQTSTGTHVLSAWTHRPKLSKGMNPGLNTFPRKPHAHLTVLDAAMCSVPQNPTQYGETREWTLV